MPRYEVYVTGDFRTEGPFVTVVANSAEHAKIAVAKASGKRVINLQAFDVDRPSNLTVGLNMKTFKTLAGARKRAAFEQAHQRHLVRRYVYRVQKRADGLYEVIRKVVDTSDNA